MVKVHISYEGGLRCRAQHEPSGTELLTDAPVDNHGKGESFSPTDLVATALGTCIATTMAIFAERHQVDLRGTTVSVTKEMATQPVRHIARLSTEVHIPVPKSHPLRESLERAALSCPVHHSLHPEMDKPVVFHWQE